MRVRQWLNPATLVLVMSQVAKWRPDRLMEQHWLNWHRAMPVWWPLTATPRTPPSPMPWWRLTQRGEGLWCIYEDIERLSHFTMHWYCSRIFHYHPVCWSIWRSERIYVGLRLNCMLKTLTTISHRRNSKAFSSPQVHWVLHCRAEPGWRGHWGCLQGPHSGFRLHLRSVLHPCLWPASYGCHLSGEIIYAESS